VRHCTLRGLDMGVGTTGLDRDYKSPLLVSDVILRDNYFESCPYGIIVRGAARRIHIVGNRFWGARRLAIQLERLLSPTEGILIANNTIMEGGHAFRLWDSAVRGTKVRLCNNLVLAAKEPDMVFLDSDNPNTSRGPGDGRSVHRVGQVDHNWREGKRPAEKRFKPVTARRSAGPLAKRPASEANKASKGSTPPTVTALCSAGSPRLPPGAGSCGEEALLL
jgi:hypothetical protein